MEKRIIKFTAPWCIACKNLEPYLIQAEKRGIKVERINVDENRDKANEYQVQSLPTVIFLNGEKEVSRTTGTGNDSINKIKDF